MWGDIEFLEQKRITEEREIDAMVKCAASRRKYMALCEKLKKSHKPYADI